MAALVGWDPAVVQRARERCQRLFAEGMSLNRVDEGPYDGVGGADTGVGDQSALRDGEIMYGGVHLDGFMQPIRRGAKKGSRKGRQEEPTTTTTSSRRVRTSRSAEQDQNQAEDEEKEEPGQADTLSTAPVGADEEKEEAEDHVCKDCGTTSTPMWRIQPDESWLCNSCHLYFRKHRRHKGNVRDVDRRAIREVRSVGPV